MKRLYQWILTCTIVAAALVALLVRYEEYLIKPWTRDGQVQADIITIASRVTGPVEFVGFVDNQYVKKGELLFTIDKSTFIAALNLAQAKLEEAEANTAEALDLYERALKLVEEDKDAIARQAVVQLEYAWRASQAETRAARAAVDEARLNLDYTEIYAPVSGYITNYSLYTGTISVADTPLFSIVDDSSFWIFGYFRETEVQRIRAGDTAEITLMGYPDRPLHGVVQSIGWGISQMNTQLDAYLLPQVNPTFEWIRLAQRIPVRIHLTHVPKNVVLRVGITASILVDTAVREQGRVVDGEWRRKLPDWVTSDPKTGRQ
ncbi:MAG: HlyD family secretion protein [Desulfovibrionales bacterium]|nr:HlyD family secretion protein [Desulfovibrionales bacterium]